MNIPNLPTDNLYKFIAISGIIIFIFSLWFMLTKSESLLNRHYLIFEKTSSIKYLQDEAKIKIARLEQQIITNKATGSETSLDSITDDYLSEINSYVANIDKEFDLVQLQLHQLDGDVIKLNSLFLILKGMLFLSVLISLIGFVLWYKKVQFYHDIILKESANKNE